MTRLAIVGAGPSATYVLDRLAAFASSSNTSVDLELHIFDKGGVFGAGEVHSPKQPRTSFLNRIAGQVSFAADETVEGAGPLLDPSLRPTLVDWCRDRFIETGDPKYDLGPADWPKRHVHGEALLGQFERYRAILTAIDGVSVSLHTDEVVDVEDRGEYLRLSTMGGADVDVDDILFATGHSSNHPKKYADQAEWAAFAQAHPEEVRFVGAAYPLDMALPQARDWSQSVVACRGLGLTTIDVILHLTEGMGGRFIRDEQSNVLYEPSGREPKAIVAFSRAGLFTLARPFNAKEADLGAFEHRGVFLTKHFVDSIRETADLPVALIAREKRRQLSFEEHILPALVLEMAHLYYTTLYGKQAGSYLESAARPTHDAFISEGGFGPDIPLAIDRLLAPLEAAVDEIVGEITAILAGKQHLSVGRSDSWNRGAALERYLSVVLGPESSTSLTESFITDPPSARRALEATQSPHGIPLNPAENRFSWAKTIAPLRDRTWNDPDEYREDLIALMDRDHLFAAQNNLTNPEKSAADGVWRDLRDVLSHAIDFGGLTAEAHAQFLDVYMRHHNRLCNGAALEVMDKILALVKSGVVDVSAGPGASAIGDEASGRYRVIGPQTGYDREVEVLIDARVHGFDAQHDVMPLYPNLLRRGLVQKWRNPSREGSDFEPGGIDLTAGFHPVGRDGRVDRRLTFLGPPSEGVMFFQLGALRPNQNHHVMRDILVWLYDFWPSVALGDRQPSAIS